MEERGKEKRKRKGGRTLSSLFAPSQVRDACGLRRGEGKKREKKREKKAPRSILHVLRNEFALDNPGGWKKGGGGKKKKER